MDAKQTAMLAELHAKFVAGDFGETDIQSLLGLVREESTVGGPIRELGDFAAHRRRNCGPVHRYLKEIKTILDRLGTQNDLLKVGVIFSESEIANAIGVALADHGLPPLSITRHRQIQLALLSMLQGASFNDKGTDKRFGALELVAMRSRFELRGVVTLKNRHGTRVAVPALSVVNECFPMQSQHGEVKSQGMIKVSVRDGLTVLEGLKRYETHIGRKRDKGGAYPSPIVWAEIAGALEGLPVSALRPDAGEVDIQNIDGLSVTFTLNGDRLSFHGRPEYFLPQSPIWQTALALKHRLGARVFDDNGGYMFETPESANRIDVGA